ncbi:acetate uptake transporter [Chloroflexota bacterium]
MLERRPQFLLTYYALSLLSGVLSPFLLEDAYFILRGLGTTAFLSFGFFWLTLVGLLVMPLVGWGNAAGPTAMVAYLITWGVFTLVMFFATLKLSRALQFIFGSLAILFFLLAIGDATDNTIITRIAGFEGIIVGISAIYTGLAQVLNEVYGKTIAPIGNIKK